MVFPQARIKESTACRFGLMLQFAKRLRPEETGVEVENYQPKACTAKRHLMHAKVYHNPAVAEDGKSFDLIESGTASRP